MKIKKILSLVLSLMIVFSLGYSAFATEVFDGDVRKVISKITSQLQEVIDELTPEEQETELIPVWVWYEDVDQEEIDEITYERTGLTPEKCAVITEMPSVPLIMGVKENNQKAIAEMKVYSERTKEIRSQESELTDTYITSRRTVSRERYDEKNTAIKEALSISETQVEFNSQYAPMIIANMTAKDIIESSKENFIESIDLFVDEEPIPEEELVDYGPKAITANVDEVWNGTFLNLTGTNVKIGIADSHNLVFKNIDSASLFEEPAGGPINEYIDNNYNHVIEYGNIVFLYTNNPAAKIGHPNKVANAAVSFAPNIKIYSGEGSMPIMESMLSLGVDVINYSLEYGSNSVNYNSFEKWFDHIISQHNVAVTVSGGNTVSNDNRRITSPGRAYNIITTGAYMDILGGDGKEDHPSMNKDTMHNFMYEEVSGSCEKPDVVMPAGSTSEASPLSAALIALMYELRPSLALYPHAAKAILLASCHRKVSNSIPNDSAFNNIIGLPEETMVQGITERQGAGAPDAWIMACIVSQGTYGCGVMTSVEQTINFVEPPYGSDNINFSLTWIKENKIEASHNNESSVIESAQAYNLDLYAYKNGNYTSPAASSEIANSSTEMCYFNMSNTNFNYRAKIVNKSISNPIAKPVRYAYAWSRNENYGTVRNNYAIPTGKVNDSGIYYIRNVANNKFLTYNATTLQLATPVNFSDNHLWIVNYSQTNDKKVYYNITPGKNVSGGVSSNTSNQAIIAAQPNEIRLLRNDNLSVAHGSISIFNEATSKMLSYSGSNAVWDSSVTPILNQTWYLEKVNYRRGDLYLSGELSVTSVTLLQKYMSKLETLNNLQYYLADINYDNNVNISDVTALQKILSGINYW